MAEADFEDMDEGASSGSQLSGRFSRISNISGNSLFMKAALSQRIVSVEYYMTAPVKEFDNMYSDFRSSAVKRVPVIRIFGSSPAGQKICANIHGVYPYVSVLDDDTVEGFEYRIATALDNAINDSIDTNRFRKDHGSYNNTQHVFKVLRVVGRTFYGYRSNNEVFLRIFFYNPMILKKAVDLLQSGSILGRRFQPYEAHIPYSLQFMIDYSLYGMNFVHYEAVKFRRKERNEESSQIEDLLPSSQSSVVSNCSLASFVDPDSIPEGLLGPLQLIKSTLCELEVDVLASDILMDTNSSGKSVNPGIDCIWKDEIERRRQHGVEDCSQITIPESQERSQAELVHPTEDKFRQLLWGKVQSFFDNSNMDDGHDSSLVFETSQSLLDDPEALQSSQVHDHLSSESKDKVGMDNQMSQEEDEFIKLLEEMAAGVDNETTEDAAGANFNIIDEPGDAEDEDSFNEEACDNEDIWNDSFISSSMLEKISDAEMSHEESRKPEETNSSEKPPVILQCDGQVGDSDSDSSSDHPSVSTRTRSSPQKEKAENPSSRTSRHRSKKTDKEPDPGSAKGSNLIDKQRRQSNRLSSSAQLSPAHRLSLTMRRKSRSQETKSSSEVSTSTKSVTRKSLSMRSSSATPTIVNIQTKSSSAVQESLVPNTKTNPKDTTDLTNSKKALTTTSTLSKSTESPSTATSLSHVNQASNSDSKMVARSSKLTPAALCRIIPNNIKNVANQILQRKEVVVYIRKLEDEVPSASGNQPKLRLQNQLDFSVKKQLEDEITSSSGSQSKLDDEALSLSSAESQPKLEDQLPSSCEDQVPSSAGSQPKRARRKPRRFRDDDDAVSISSSISQKSSTDLRPKLDTAPPDADPDIVLIQEIPHKKIKNLGNSLEASTKAIKIKQDDTNEPSPAVNVNNITPTVEIKEEESNGSKNLNSTPELVKRKTKKKRLGMSKTAGSNSSKQISLPSPAIPSGQTADQTQNGEDKPISSLPLQIKDSSSSKDIANTQPLPTSATTVDTVTKKLVSKKRIKLKRIKVSSVGISCKPLIAAATVQTEPVKSSETSVQVQPETMNKSSQIIIQTQVEETQTPKLVTLDAGTENPNGKMITVATQTDIVKPMCLCQCTCVYKEKADVAVDIQNELKPIMESKRIQVDNVDIIARARAARFTTPQSNKIKITTPARCPEKRKTFTDSPKRRPVSAMLSAPHSRFLNALVLKTPTSTHKYRSSFRESPSTPTDNTSPSTYHKVRKTPPSKEDYLMNVLSASCSPRVNRRCSIKPRNLHNETSRQEDNGDEVVGEIPERDLETMKMLSSSVDSEARSASITVDQDQAPMDEDSTELTESLECDLSVNSIYEYEDTPTLQESVSPSPATSQILPEPDSNNDYMYDEISTPQNLPIPIESPLSSFQKKRILSRNRSRIRLEKRRTATLEANRDVPDIFDSEFEPLKQPPSYKSTVKWLEAETHPHKHLFKNVGEEALEDIFDNSSDEEELPPSVRLFGGGNMSDEDDEDADAPSSQISNASIDDIRNGVKPFTPPPEVTHSQSSMFDEVSQSQGSCSGDTPRSILRQRGVSRRQSGVILKRKIRWGDDEDEEEAESSDKKRRKTENGSAESCALTNDSINKTADISELDGPSVKNALGLENSMSNFQDVKAVQQCQFLTTMCVEVHCASRNGLTPDPAIDPILAIFILISSDYPENFRRPREYMNILLVENVNLNGITIESSQRMKAFPGEREMMDAFFGLVRFWDPDILVGYEVEKSSFGYLIQRAFQLDKDAAQELSRVLPFVRKDGQKGFYPRRNEEWNGTISGRIVLNLWSLLRHEVAVNSYTFENMAYHILRRRVYKLSFKALAGFWTQKINRIKVVQYYTVRIKGAIQIMEKLDLINRTSELARLFGIQFYEVLSRGSQFRVESMMLRATKPLDYVAPSPTVMQRAKMRAPEFLPLIMEPRSNYYTDPVAVLDFQSLYPSMMIAYNYDYASLIGRVEHLGSTDRFPIGCLDHQMSPAELLQLKDHIHISPCGVAFLDKSVVRGIVPEMLEQILDTRQMVKRAMKKWKNDGMSLKKVLDSRQLGLKLIANVTYGYTSANFSGRMPCVEIADSIVSKGRETLQRAIDFVKENFNRWGAEVIYGDTDSMFLLFRGRSREEAFKLAYEIADEVTQANPKPVKLKFEKIYQPCILQTKKRYVGYAYETPDQEKPVYDAKGIETVRRDGCPAVRKILEKTLHILFSTNKPAKVQEYVKFQFEKLFKGRVSMQDYIFARKYRGRSGYKPTASVPALEIAKKLTAVDPRAEPLTSERVPYVVIYGDPNLPLIKLVRRPEEFLENPSMRLNAHYYIEKVIIPALNRCLKLASLDASKWYLQMPRKYLRNVLEQKPGGQRTLDHYILHQNCFRCDGRAERWLCDKCLEDETSSVIYLQEIVRTSKSKLSSCIEICTNCAGESGRCISIDCPILHKLARYERDQVNVKNIERELINLEW